METLSSTNCQIACQCEIHCISAQKNQKYLIGSARYATVFAEVLKILPWKLLIDHKMA